MCFLADGFDGPIMVEAATDADEDIGIFFRLLIEFTSFFSSILAVTVEYEYLLVGPEDEQRRVGRLCLVCVINLGLLLDPNGRPTLDCAIDLGLFLDPDGRPRPVFFGGHTALL